MKTILTLALAAFAFTTTAQAAGTYICRADANETTKRVVVVGDGIFMVCESPKDEKLSSMEQKRKYCAASSLIVTSAGHTNGEGVLIGETFMQHLNKMHEKLVVEFRFVFGVQLTATLKLSQEEIASEPKMVLPLESNYVCDSK
jgi:hypothetical protein